MDNTIRETAINTIRLLSVEAIQKANSGHPGLPMGTAHIGYLIYHNHMRFDPKDPKWIGRDRFVVSAGHGSMLLYSLLHLTGYELTLDDIKNFRQWGSITPGHPEYGMTPGVETTTGPLGQGIGNAVGMAIASKMMGEKYNNPELFENNIFVICGDGDMMEGIASEASSLAGHLKLDNIVMVYDDNKITIEGSTELAFSEDVGKRYESYGWNVVTVEEGYDLDKVDIALTDAVKYSGKPSLIVVKTTIGYGSPNKAGSHSVHGSPLGDPEIKLTKEALGWKHEESFYVPDEVKTHFSELSTRMKETRTDWESKYYIFKKEFPELAGELIAELEYDTSVSGLSLTSDKDKIATRAASGIVLNKVSELVPNLVGGSADLAPSTKTNLNNEESFSVSNRKGKNFHFGIREHAMGAVMNGMSLYGGLRVFGSTFHVFSDYLRPSIRLSAIMKQNVIYIFTHDSVAVGEDGPTHQPVEQTASLRAIPGLSVFRPADFNETVYTWKKVMSLKETPTAIILSRQGLPVLKEVNENAMKGAYILSEGSKEKLDMIMVASGSEVHLAMEAKAVLLKENGDLSIRVVSIPCVEVFEEQNDEYRKSVLPPSCRRRLVIEAGISMGWDKYATDFGKIISIDRYGESAPGDMVLEKLGISVENVVNTAKEMLN